MTKELTCIRCPIGCQLTAVLEGNGIVISGNSCPRGAEYGKKEVTVPTRIVTGSVRVTGGELPLVSVKTVADVHKEKMLDVMRQIHTCQVRAPVRTGDVLIRDAAGTGADIIATRTVGRAQSDK